ncbi:C4-dicarboxylate ABC transporter substrate-binding protein [Rhodovulum imhoffii]|nr:C4-dicarboxylate ABC transporter substrate-binding protein [Rhodovulum imhoffii]
MISGYLALARWLDKLSLAICVTAGMFLTGATLLIVVLRYGYGAGFIQLQDAAAYAFTVLLAFSLPVTLARGGHVRVEVLSERMPSGYVRVADTGALILFLIPVFALMLYAYWPDLRYAWSIREASLETGGLGGLYLVKTTLPVSAALMIVQGVAAVVSSQVQKKGEAGL